MGNNQKRIEVIDAQTGEVFGLNVGMLVGDVRDVLLSKRRQQMMATTWGNLSESDQKDEIRAASALAEDLVKAVVDMVAAAGNEVIHAKLDNFKIKDGAVTLTAKGAADDGALLALNHVGHKNLKIIVANADQFDQQRETVAAEKDQPGFFSGDGENDHVSDADMYDRARALVLKDQKASASYIQRKLGIGYNRASAMMDLLEQNGIVSKADAETGKRSVLVRAEMTDDEVNDIAAAMDADADAMDEPDDLHDSLDDSGPGDGMPDADPKPPVSDDRVAGYHARMQGQTSKAGPDINAPERDEWYLGWKEADDSGDAPAFIKDDQPEPEVEVEPVAADPEAEVAESEPEAISPKTVDLGGLSPVDHGAQSRLKGDGPDGNPFDGGTPEHVEWADGYSAADVEIKQLIEQGRAAGAKGDDKKACPWKKGTDGERFWLEGWNAGKGSA